MHAKDTKDLKFYTQLELAVVGQNSEMADMSNPNGDIIREVAVLIAEDKNGNRWVVQNLGEWVDTTDWLPIQAAYGSQAYQKNEAEYVALERREDVGFDAF